MKKTKKTTAPAAEDEAWDVVATNWHRATTQWWAEIGIPWLGVTESAANLVAMDKAGELAKHVLRKLTLDLVCASFPANCPPPDALVELLRRALDLPDSHRIGGWAGIAGTHDDRGGIHHLVRSKAKDLDVVYRLEHRAIMPARKLARLVEKELRRKCSHTSIIRWRKEDDYWAQ